MYEIRCSACRLYRRHYHYARTELREIYSSLDFCSTKCPLVQEWTIRCWMCLHFHKAARTISKKSATSLLRWNVPKPTTDDSKPKKLVNMTRKRYRKFMNAIAALKIVAPKLVNEFAKTHKERKLEKKQKLENKQKLKIKTEPSIKTETESEDEIS